MSSNKSIKEFKENGYTIIKNFLNPKEIKNIKMQMNDVLSTQLSYHRIKFGKKMSVDDKYFLLKNKKPKLKSHFWDIMRISESLNSIVYSKKNTNLIKKILKSETILATNVRLQTDSKKEKGNLPLHQELNNISNESVLLWCPLVKVNKKTGGLCLIPKSHIHGHLNYTDSEIPAHFHRIGLIDKLLKGKEKIKYNNKIIESLFDKKNLLFPCLNPTDAILFGTFVFHGSTNYKSNGVRWVVAANYHKPNKIPYLLKEDFKSDKNKNYRLEMNRPMRIPYKVDYNKII
jgi:ectoine hydroxylase-related dioxygenase (phytanoyl-CoA dioxygenase family)